MDEAEFHIITQQLLMLGGLVQDVKLTEYINAIERADAVGPVFNPTLWMRGHKKTDILKKMAEGLRAFQKSLPTAEEAKKADLAVHGL